MPKSHDVGRAGEFIAAARLEKNGWRAVIADAEGVDLLAMRDNKVVRMQVKSSASLQRNKYYFHTRRGANRRPLTKSDCDVVCFVAVDLGFCFFSKVEKIKSTTTIFKRSVMTAENERESFFECFAEV